MKPMKWKPFWYPHGTWISRNDQIAVRIFPDLESGRWTVAVSLRRRVVGFRAEAVLESGKRKRAMTADEAKAWAQKSIIKLIGALE